MEANEWIQRFAMELGVEPPSAGEIEELLDVASSAAHSSERKAAPIACWMIGRSGRPAAELSEQVRRAGV